MTLMPVEEALSRIVAGVKPLSAETVVLDKASDRVLAVGVSARLTQPPFDSSAMDGYAVRAMDASDSGCRLRVIGESAAGRAFHGDLSPGEAIRVFTGAPLPSGADSIVIQENVTRQGDWIELLEGTSAGRHVRAKGGDFREGDVLLPPGLRLSARALTLTAAMNHATVSVVRRPVVAILATGDELVSPGEQPRADQIVSSIPAGLAAMIEAAGGEPRFLGIASDTLDSLASHLRASADADILVTIGGASVGDHDLVRPALEAHGATIDFYKIAMRPGKPLMYGSRASQKILGLPGNPISALVCARLFLYPLIRAMTGEVKPDILVPAVLTAPLEPNGGRTHYMRGITRGREGGYPTVEPIANQDSAHMALFAAADCLIVRKPDAAPAVVGDVVEILILDF